MGLRGVFLCLLEVVAVEGDRGRERLVMMGMVVNVERESMYMYMID